MDTIHVRAVEGRMAPLHAADGTPRAARFAGRGPGPEFTALLDGEDIPDHPEHRRAIAHGDLELSAPRPPRPTTLRPPSAHASTPAAEDTHR